MQHRLFVFFALILSGCGGGGDGGSDAPTVSTGLKIFITAESHVGDFAGDPTLTGTTAIEKADAFCNTSSAKPSADTYKALIVDGVNRDAVSQTNWVLQPNTAYYQPYGNVLIDTTSNAAIFTAFYRNMSNPINPCGMGCNAPSVWTGIGDASIFAVSSNTCLRWGEDGNPSGHSAVFGVSTRVDGVAFSTGGSSNECSSIPSPLYCVQQ